MRADTHSNTSVPLVCPVAATRPSAKNVSLFRANASLNLVNQMKKVDGLVSGFEKNLSEDGPIPDEPNAIKNHIQDIQVSKSSSPQASPCLLVTTLDTLGGCV